MRDIPAIPERVEPDLRKVLVRIREELQSLLAFRGDASSAAVLRGQPSSSAGTVVVLPGGGGPSPSQDLTPPPTPTFGPGDVIAGFTNIIVQWSGTGYAQGGGHKQANVYAVKRDPASTAALPTFSSAVLVGSAPHPLLQVALPSELNTRWHVWVKFETNDGVESVTPAGGVNGVTATTGQDVDQLLDLLTGQITASQLYYDLARPIARLGRLEDESAADTLAAALAASNESFARTSALLVEAQDRGTAITETRRLQQVGDLQLAQSITTLTATVQSGDAASIAAVQAESSARASAIAAEAAARTTLAAEVQHPTTGLAVTRATLLNDYTTTVGMNAAIASSASTLTAAYQGADATISAAVSTEASVRASETGHLAAQATTRLDLNGYVVGYGLSGTSGGTAGPTSQFLVRVDQFAVVPPTEYTGPTAPTSPTLNQRWFRTTDRVVLRWDGAAWASFNYLPFVIQASPTTENGVTIPAGVYMDSTYIRDLSAVYARIQNLVADQITTASLSAAQITSGFLSAARIQAGSITADKLSVALLSAVSASLGSVQIAAGGSLSSGQTAFDTGTGFWLGAVAGTPKFSIGSAAGALLWDGAALTLRGDLVLKQNITAAANNYATHNGPTTSSVTAEHAFAALTTTGFVVLAGVNGYVEVFLNTSAARHIRGRARIVASNGVDTVVGPDIVLSCHGGGGVLYGTTGSYLYELPVSMTWAFTGSYWSSRKQNRPGVSGILPSPTLVENFLTTGAWVMLLEVSVDAYSAGSGSLSSAIDYVRTSVHGWAVEVQGSKRLDPASPIL